LNKSELIQQKIITFVHSLNGNLFYRIYNKDGPYVLYKSKELTKDSFTFLENENRIIFNKQDSCYNRDIICEKLSNKIKKELVIANLKNNFDDFTVNKIEIINNNI
jgi:hypothetical protein